MTSKLSLRLIIWNRAEGLERAEALRAAGYQVQFDPEGGPELLRQLKETPPVAVLIDLGRLPSQGREIGVALRLGKATRHIPLVFIGGEPEKVARIQALLPDAVFTEWRRIRSALRRALLNPPAQPVTPKSIFEAYRGTPLVKKLGIRAGYTVGLVGAPAGFPKLLGDLPEGARLVEEPGGASDLLIWFVHSAAELTEALTRMSGLADRAPMWIAWPKKAAGVASDLSQQGVRATGLAEGLVDYKICAIDQTWAALLFRRRT